MARADSSRLENLVGALALAVADRIREETETTIGHTGATAAALVSIAHFPARTVDFLSRAIGLSHSATVRVVDRLVEQGLVRRRRGSGGPALALTVTPAGKRHARKLIAVRRRVLADALSGLSRSESEVLASALEKALRNLTDPLGGTICRLCDQGSCRGWECPVAERQTELGKPPPEPVPLGPDDSRPGRPRPGSRHAG